MYLVNAPNACKAFVGKPAPDFTAQAVLADNKFKPISLSDYQGKYLVLFFYPFDFGLVCPTEVLAFNERVDDFHNIDCEVIAASTQSQYNHLAWKQAKAELRGIGELKIPMVADQTKKMARDYGILLPDKGVALRGSFIIDTKGILRQMTINDLPVGRNVDETLRLVQAFQFTDKHGEVCPAGWRPGKKTIRPAAAKEYFEKANA